MTIDRNPAYMLTSDGVHELWMINFGTEEEPQCEWYVFDADSEYDELVLNNAHEALAMHLTISSGLALQISATIANEKAQVAYA